MELLDKAAARLQAVSMRLINMGLDPDVILNGPAPFRSHPFFAVGGECGRVYGDIGDVLREVGASTHTPRRTLVVSATGEPPGDALVLSELELTVLKRALDVYMRVHLGQADAVFQPLVEHLILEHENCDSLEEIRELFKPLQTAITGSPNGGPGLYSPKVSNRARVARRIQARLEGDETALRLSSPEGEVTR
jgi:hypothetical protein